MSARGFTLVELLVSIAITGLMGGIVVQAFSASLATRDAVESESTALRGARAALFRMVREVECAFVSDRYDLKRFRDANDRPTNFIGKANELTFTSLAHVRLHRDAKESDQMVVAYSLKSHAKGAQLVRRENPFLDGNLERGGTEDVLLENVSSLSFEYFDPEKQEWDDEWDTRRLERKSALPTRVRIAVKTSGTGKTEDEARFQTTASLFLLREFPRF